MNNKLLRIIALVLVSLMLVFAVACTDPGEGSAETSGNGSSVTSGNSGESGNNQQPDNSGNSDVTGGGESQSGPAFQTETFKDSTLPDDLHFGNTVTVLYWSDVEEPEFEVEKISLNHTENAIYYRNMNTVTNLGLDAANGGLVWVGFPGNHGQKEEFTEHVGASYLSGKRDYDIIATYSRTAGLCAINGYFADLADIDGSYIDLTQTWWTPSLVETVEIDDSIYFLSGDISTNTLHMMYSIFCNTEMVKELNLDDPVEMVIDNDWTLDEFKSLCEGVFSEKNGDSKPSVGDRFGFITEQLHTDAFYQGSGLDMIEKDEDDVLIISPDFESAKLSNLVNDLREFYATQDVRVGSAGSEFVNENALFTQNRLYYAENYLSEVDFKYACLPTPMYNDKQDGYRTCVGNPFTLWGIMKDVEEDEDMLLECTAVLESLAYEGYRNTTPQIFEANMKVKYSDDEDINTVKTFDLIREGVVYDLGRIFPDTEMGGYMNEFFSRTIVGSDDWSSVLAANLFLLEGNLSDIVDKFDKHKYGG